MTKVDSLSAADVPAGLPDRGHEIIVRHVGERPHHPAFVEGDRVWSYGEFADAVDAVAADFARRKRAGRGATPGGACAHPGAMRPEARRTPRIDRSFCRGDGP